MATLRLPARAPVPCPTGMSPLASVSGGMGSESDGSADRNNGIFRPLAPPLREVTGTPGALNDSPSVTTVPRRGPCGRAGFLRKTPRAQPPGPWRAVSGSHVASSGQSTRTTTINTMIMNIGRAVLAM